MHPPSRAYPLGMQLPEPLSTLEHSAIQRRFATLIAPKTPSELEAMAAESRALTLRHFGRTIRMFAPLYLSNECINSCKYCGFARENPITRVTLELDQVAREARHLAIEGFRNILLVAGEHPKFVSNGYLEQCVARLRPAFPAISLEVGPMETADYIPIVRAGAEGLVVYQETYHRQTYAELHTFGPKKDFDWRLACPVRAYDAGFRRIGIGALFGLWHWREEARALAAHLEHLQKRCWKAQITLSLPRLRPAAGEFTPPHPVSDRDFVQLLCALRICFPQTAIVLSTRESAQFRDHIIPLGVTMISAGSHTEPGGYTGAGRDALHQTVRGRPIPLDSSSASVATEQFAISDSRPAAEMASALRRQGYEAVWKDWDHAITGT